MFVVMVTVQSLDGKMTHGDDPEVRHWNSDEDSEHFIQLLHDYNLIIMGRKMYEKIRGGIWFKPGKLRVVMTHHPEQYADETIPGQLEFTAEQPADLLARLQKAGQSRALLAGGGQIYAAFMKAGLIDEMLATIEPRMFGSGVEMLASVPVDVQLQLQTVTRLNDRGTLLLRYTVRH